MQYMPGWGKHQPLLRIFWKTSWGVSSLKGGTPVRNSKRHTPSAHQSTMQSERQGTRSYSGMLQTPGSQHSKRIPVRGCTTRTAVAEAGTRLDCSMRLISSFRQLKQTNQNTCFLRSYSSLKPEHRELANHPKCNNFLCIATIELDLTGKRLAKVIWK